MTGLVKKVHHVAYRCKDAKQTVECVFCDLMARCRPRELAVWARYTRRGGLDINPFRASRAGLLPDEAMEVRQ